MASNMSGSPSQYNFISEPSDTLKCLLCLKVAEEPWQHGKAGCGGLYCHKCLDQHGKEKPCPKCGTDEPNYFEDSRSTQEIKSLVVRCYNAERKCEWTGTVGTLEDHLSTCSYAPAPCPNNCSKATKLTLDQHLAEECPNRKIECEYCGEEGTYTFVTNDHAKTCELKVLRCTNAACGLNMQRRYFYQHVQFECDHTVIACRHKSIGCAKKMKRKDMTSHEQDDTLHLHMAINTISLLKERSTALQKGEPMTFQLLEYQAHKEDGTVFYSPSLYSSPKGYHTTIRVDINGVGDSKGSHISVFAIFIEGEHNAEVKWPFVGKVVFTLLNQEQDSDHYERTLTVQNSDNVRAGTKCNNRGLFEYISHSALESKSYLKDDTLYFRVSVLPADHKPWLECSAQ